MKEIERFSNTLNICMGIFKDIFENEFSENDPINESSLIILGTLPCDENNKLQELKACLYGTSSNMADSIYQSLKDNDFLFSVISFALIKFAKKDPKKTAFLMEKLVEGSSIEVKVITEDQEVKIVNKTKNYKDGNN